MSRQPKRGLDFVGWNTDIFENDTKIDELLDAQGWIGFSIYFYLCMKAYASDGYFYRWSYANAPTTARRMGGGISSDTVINTVKVCLRVGLFDKDLLDVGILTSKGIQRRFVAAIQKRSYKVVDQSIWLLDEAETKGSGIIFEKDKKPGGSDNRTEKADFLPEKADFLPEKGHKSKVKESKGEYKKETLSNESAKKAPPKKAAPPTPQAHKYGEYGWVLLTDAQYEKLVKDLGKAEADRCIAYVDESAQQTSNKNKWHDWNLTVRKCHRDKWGQRSNGTPVEQPQRSTPPPDASKRERPSEAEIAEKLAKWAEGGKR